MWNGTPFIYSVQFNSVILDLVAPELKRFYQEFVIFDPDRDEDQAPRPIFPAIESFVISDMTRNHNQITKKLIFTEFRQFLSSITEALKNEPEFLFMTINREVNGTRKFFPRTPLPGEPELRTIFHFEDPPETMSTADWGITPIRFLLHFRPVIQEYISEDSGVEDES